MNKKYENLETEFLPLNCNWITSNLLPKYDENQKTFVEPYLPNYKRPTRPNANATTVATKSGGFIPKYPATTTATAAAPLAQRISSLSLISGLKERFTKS